MVHQVKIQVKTPSHEALVSITHGVSNSLKQLKLRDGIVHAYVMHTTCGMTINENADPSVVHDLLSRLDKLIPWHDPDDRHAEGNSAAHLKSSLFGSSVTIPVKDGRLVLGTWQGIFLGEFDGPRTRTIHLTSLF